MAAPGGPTASTTDFSSVVLPADIGQSGLQVYVKKRSIRSGTDARLLAGQRREAVYGNPISEPFASPTGFYSRGSRTAS